MEPASQKASRTPVVLVLAGLAAATVVGLTALRYSGEAAPRRPAARNYEPRKPGLDVSGSEQVTSNTHWDPGASLDEVSKAWQGAGYREIEKIDRQLAQETVPDRDRVGLLLAKAQYYNYEGEADKAYRLLGQARAVAEGDRDLAEEWHYTIVYFQGVTGLRLGENDNCILCRGESSCILPIAPSAVHTKPDGSRLAIKHLSEYLRLFPDDLEVRWLLNLAHMTLGEHPGGVDPGNLLPLDHFQRSEFDIGRFRDVGAQVGVNRLNHAGGGIMEDFDNDGLLDILVTAMNPTAPMAFYRNKGDGTF
jgi:hypothetical protein